MAIEPPPKTAVKSPPGPAENTYYRDVAVALLLWTGLWAWLIRRLSTRYKLLSVFALIAGYAVIAGIAAYHMDFIIHYHERHP